MDRLHLQIDNVVQDIRFAVRTLAKTPGVTAVAILSIALGIGANTAIFSLIDALMWRTLPVRDPQNLMSVAIKRDQTIEREIYYRDLGPMRDNSQLAELTAFTPLRLNMTVEGNPEPSTDAEMVAGNYFSLLGVQPIAGRAIGVDDDRVLNGHPVAMISYRYWGRRFGLAPATLGRTLSISGQAFTIIGVTPPEFFGVEVGLAPDVFVPMAMQPTVLPDPGGFAALARVKPGIAPEQAAAELDTLFRRAQRPSKKPDTPTLTTDAQKFAEASSRERHVIVTPAAAGVSKLRDQFSRPLFILMAAVGVVLLIACANIANLLLARAATRRPEFAMRVALGARRSRLAAQLLTESLLLAGTGGAVGILLACWATKLLVVFLSVGQAPIALDLHPDFRVLCFTMGIAIMTGLLFGLAPAVNSTRIDLSSALKRAGNSSGAIWMKPGNILVVFQVSLSLLLLIGAGLFVGSLQNLCGRESEVPRESVSLIRIDAPRTDYRNRPEWHRLDNAYRDLLQTVKQLPGVRSASLAEATPASPIPGNFEGLLFPSGKWSEPFERVSVFPNYFATAGIPVVAGRDFTQGDDRDTSPVCVVNEAFAQKMYPGENVLGKPCLHSYHQPYEIIGIVKDSRLMNPTREIAPIAYTTFLGIQSTRPAMTLYLRMAGNPNLILPRIQQDLARIDPALPQLEIHTLARDMDAALIRERLIAMLSTLFGALALILACVGLYGLLAFAVVQRTAEVGIRMALGASRLGIVWIVMRDALKLVATGIALGVPVALAAARFASIRFPSLFGSQGADPALAAIKTDTGLLFGVTTTNPLTLALAATVLCAAAAIAAYLPARRASQMDPIVALRTD